MIGVALHRLDRLGRGLVPVLATLLLLLVEMSPVPVPTLGAAPPMLGLMAVHYWAIHRPDLMRPVVAFALGVLQDLLGGGPLGLNALVYVLAHWILLNQRRFFVGSSFLMLWWGFALIALGAAVLNWAASSVLAWTALPPQPALFQAMLSIAVFPGAAWLLIRAHRFLRQPA